jgi:hypothetical protein
VPGRVGIGDLELIVDLGPEHCHAAWGLDAELDALTVDGKYRNRDVFTDEQALLAFAAQNQHA